MPINNQTENVGFGLGALIESMRKNDTDFAEVTIRPQSLAFDVEGLLLDGQRIRMDQKDRSGLFRKVGAPEWYWRKHGARFQSVGLTEHLDRHDFGRSPKLILRNGEFHTIVRGDLIDLSSAEVLNAVAETLGREGESLVVSRIGRNDERFEVELVSPLKAISVRAGDIVQAGIHIIHSPYGNEPTIVEGFSLRLICTNGMKSRQCASHDGIGRTRKLSVDYPNGRELQLNQIRRLAHQHWQGLQTQLEALRATSERPANVEELLNSWLLRARISRQEMMPRLLAAWRVEGSESSHYGAVNALTRVATHDLELSARQRRVLAALAGLLAFSQVHLCEKCYSVLSTLRGTDDDSEVDTHGREKSAQRILGDGEERQAVTA